MDLLPPELAGVQPHVIKGFLASFSRALLVRIGVDIPPEQVQACVNDLLTNAAPGSQAVDVRLEFKHVCRHTGCALEDCQLCRNNPNKVCEDADCFDHQYWVRDDGKGGQLIRSRCGADVGLQLVDRATNQPVSPQDVRIKLYVTSGQQVAPPALGEPPGGLFLSDDGHQLFAAAGAAPEADRGVPVDVVQDDRLGPVAPLPELQFLDKNSKFRVGGRTFKSFRLLARATRRDAVTGAEVVLAQVESESFKVTTKKGYDGCRKADYLYAHDPITDKTFANLGETTVNNLKANFESVETVEDLMHLVQACRTQPEMEARLRETLNMARDVDKWRNLIRMLSEKVVWDDSLSRVFVLPVASRPLGLLYKATKGQVDFANPSGVIVAQPTASGQLCVGRLSERLQSGASRQLDALRQLAAEYWRLSRHPGWALVPEAPLWVEATAAQVCEAFSDVLGSGDPEAAAEMHLAAMQQAQAAAAAPFMQGASPFGAAVAPLPLDPGAVDLATMMSSGAWVGAGGLGVAPLDAAAVAAAVAAASAGGAAAMSVSGGQASSASDALLAAQQQQQQQLHQQALSMGLAAPDGQGGLSLLHGSNGQQAAAAAAAAGFGRLGVSGGSQALSLPAIVRPTLSGGPTGRPTVTTTHLGATPSAPGALQLGMMMQQPQQPSAASGGHMGGPSPFAVPTGSVHVSGRTTSGGMADSDGGSHRQGSIQQQQQQGGLLLNSSTGQPGPLLPGGGSMAGVVGGLGGGGSGVVAAMQSASVAHSGGRPTSSGGQAHSGVSGAIDSRHQPAHQQQQQQQQQLLAPGQLVAPPGQLVAPPSTNTMLLQQAILEGWPAPQVKAVLDRMTDDELRLLVSSSPNTAAGALARAGGVPQAQLQPPLLQQLQQQQQQQQQQGAVQGFSMQMTVGPEPRGAAAQQQGAGAGSATSEAAAAALAALLADAAGGAGGAGGARGSFDVSLAGDQLHAAHGPAGLSVDSFNDPAQWGDLLDNLRQLSSSTSGQQQGVGVNVGSFSTEWIPELLFRLESETKEKNEGASSAAAAAGAAGGGANGALGGGGDAAAGAGGAGGAAGPAAAAAAAPAAAAANDDSAEDLRSRKAKRERSKTGQGPTPEQLAQLQSLIANGDPSLLRSLSKAENHFGSFNRHFPVARVSSRTQDVAQGTQISNPWAPGMPMSSSGVEAGSPLGLQADGQLGRSPAGGRQPVTTHAPIATVAQANVSRMVSASALAPDASAPALNPTATTEAGAAAVAAVTGLEHLLPVPEDAESLPSNELLSVLGLLKDEAPMLGGAAATGGTQEALFITGSGSAAAAAAAAAGGAAGGASTPFLQQPADAAAATAAHGPTMQRDSSGKAGWISSLFRSGSSWSSKSNSLVASGSGAVGGSGGSHSSKDVSQQLQQQQQQLQQQQLQQQQLQQQQQ